MSWVGGGRPCTQRVLCQVPFFLFIVFVVYTLLPFTMRGAVAAGVVSSVSHLLVLGTLMGVSSSPSVRVWLQVRGSGVRGETVVWAEGSQAHGVSWSRSLEPCWQPAGLGQAPSGSRMPGLGPGPWYPEAQLLTKPWPFSGCRALSWGEACSWVSPAGPGTSLGVLPCVLC